MYHTEGSCPLAVILFKFNVKVMLGHGFGQCICDSYNDKTILPNCFHKDTKKEQWQSTQCKSSVQVLHCERFVLYFDINCIENNVEKQLYSTNSIKTFKSKIFIVPIPTSVMHLFLESVFDDGFKICTSLLSTHRHGTAVRGFK